ncbi:ubiquitin conjugating enzyme 7 interacting protein 1 [Pyrenophora tritici-repentis Pt-1C-BFP]|uniref:Ubiquitin conjugating enzyme 7 interacting protein 1 n=1 Tax=Pyrenophora tritici-repentis (strain Pt-1C-BFP) TaxID=426418 RepID=B2VTP5_PYRTR|nr:ubiquitin conjugating enzyme 7 interacting protein 1 [Pyrenophora tritici-repentis Pt-1C-BFP]EDU40328.1 ubiquitin conjugating enzyme 7 interacting protein 1 [Pyrenophora tritici-repentis Pt-1C-BFP]
MARPGINIEHEVIDLLSDSESEDEGFARHELDFFDAQSDVDFADEYPDLEEPLGNLHAQLYEHGHELIDLTGIPDIDVPPSDPIVVDDDEPPQPNAQAPDWNDADALVTGAGCLQLVLSVLPDISADYVLQLIHEKTTDATRTMARCEHLLTEILEGDPYPKESEEAKSKKRKRDDEDEDALIDYETAERDPEIGGYEHDATELLKDEFLFVPVRHLTNILGEQKTLFKAYGVLEKQVRNYGRVANSFRKNGKSRNKRGVELELINQGSQLPKELHAAKKKVELETAKRRKAQEAEEAEEVNLQQARMNNQMGECACCFDDVPLNRMISCNGDTVHFYCMECPRRQIETQLGESRCRPKCFGVENCNGTFSRRQLQEVLSDKTFERLENLQQREDLAAAGLDFLSECPFCDFKMECLPVEVDKEFRCQNAKCGKTSCRLCEKESHIPLSCEEFKKDGQITLRHIVEEAIYVCSKNVTDYNHFGDVQAGKCPLHENVEDRHEQEVKKAAEDAMAKVRADNPGLSDADLMVKVSDRVKQAEDARKGQALAQAQRFPYHMIGDELRRFPLPPQAAGAPVQPPPAVQPRAADALWNLLPGVFGAGQANRRLPGRPDNPGPVEVQDYEARQRPLRLLDNQAYEMRLGLMNMDHIRHEGLEALEAQRAALEAQRALGLQQLRVEQALGVQEAARQLQLEARVGVEAQMLVERVRRRAALATRARRR